jgi:hypothetical protein
MAMTASSMQSRIKSNISGITPVQGSGASAANAYRDAVTVAMCQGIIDEIKANMTVASSGADPQGGVVTSASTTIT